MVIPHLSQFDALVGEDRAPDVRRKLVSALIRGNDQANDAYTFSPHSDGYTYGTNRWRFNLAEVGLAMATVEGARQLNPRNSRMWVVGRAVCYPVCYASDTHADVLSARIRPSRLRSDLFAKLGRLSRYVQHALDFEIDGQVENGFIDDEDGGEDLDLALDEDYYLDAAADKLPRMVVAAYASNRYAGLLRVHVGEAVMDDRGGLHWGWHEELPIVRESGGLHVVDDGAGPGFADAPEPELDMGEADRPDEALDQDLEEPDEKQGHQPDA